MVATVQKNCGACGDLITVRLADHKRGWGKFCNKACAAAHKCGQRPSDVNVGHAKFSEWAADRVADLARHPNGKAPTAPRIKDQLGHKVKVKPIYHSPANCRDCGEAINGPGRCDECESKREADYALEEGWDGHKGAF